MEHNTSLDEREDALAGAVLGGDDPSVGTIVRYLPYAVGLLFGLGFLFFGAWPALRGELGGPGGSAATVSGDDAALVEKVRAANTIAGLADIDIDADGSTVTLTGSVVSEDSRTLAGDTARGVDGVTRVRNQLQIDSGAAAPSTSVLAATSATERAATPATVAPTTTVAASTTAVPTTLAAAATTAAVPTTVAAAAGQKLVADINAILSAEPVQFDTGLALIKPQSIATLDRVAALLSTQPAVRVEVQGHTDSRGAEDINVALSQIRAESVLAYLADKGVAPTRMVARGYGSAQLIADESSPAGLLANRRVQFAVLP